MNPTIQIIGLLLHSETETAQAMFRAGAAQYLTKDCGRTQLVTAIRESGRNLLRERSIRDD
jgi:DNA-binding NarL/FixJ family response regulator